MEAAVTTSASASASASTFNMVVSRTVHTISRVGSSHMPCHVHMCAPPVHVLLPCVAAAHVHVCAAHACALCRIPVPMSTMDQRHVRIQPMIHHTARYHTYPHNTTCIGDKCCGLGCCAVYMHVWISRGGWIWIGMSIGMRCYGTMYGCMHMLCM